MPKNCFITLLSNGSMAYFPENKTTHFVTQMPHSIHLEGDWVVGITEFHYPCSLLTINSNENIIYLKRNWPNGTIENFKTRLPTGIYNDIASVVTALNQINELKIEVEFVFDKLTNRVSVKFLADLVTHLKFSPKLAVQLGFEPDQNVFKNNQSIHPGNILLGLPSQIFIYSDILEPQIVGDYFTKLLRNVSIENSNYTYGSSKSYVFNPVHYIPVLKREFENIEIDMRSDTGDNIPFIFGTSSVKLHFKKVESFSH